MSDKLTVLIPCKNEIKNIRPCIESVRAVADEIIVADSGSTDGTMDVARGMGGCRIIEREYIDYGNFTNWAIPQASHPWVLILDADERVTPELAAEIKRVLQSPACDGYEIRRRNFIFGHEIKYCGWNHDRVLHLFRRELGRNASDGPHAMVVVSSGKVGKLKAKLVHYTYWSMEQYLRKLDSFTTQVAADLKKKGRRPSTLGLLTRAPFRFLHLYIFRGGFLDGVPGLILCMLTAFYSFTKYAKLWAVENGHSQPDPEAEQALALASRAKPARIAA